MHYTVFIGRFQPFHRGHYAVVQKALEMSDQLIIVLGSHDKAPDSRNPLSVGERIEIINASLTTEERSRVRFASVPDFMYNDDKWIAGIQSAVFSVIHSGSFVADKYEISLVGMLKDHTSYYLNIFPQWKSIPVDPVDKDCLVSATDIRQAAYMKNIYPLGETNILDFMVNEQASDLFLGHINDKPNLSNEFLYEERYGEKWGSGPHLTVDCAIVQAGHILMIQRGSEYGHNKWALPGGFINQWETTKDAMIRELQEETQIKVPEKVLRGSIERSKLYDHPYRSNRARIVTHAFYIRLDDKAGSLPKVKGSDDAQDAKWIPLSKVMKMRSELFEDHYDIISDLVGV